jgi:hypothetical protein
MELLNTPTPCPILVDNYTSDSEEDTGFIVKRKPGRPKKIRTREELASIKEMLANKKPRGRPPSKVDSVSAPKTTKPRGRPMKVRTPEELEAMKAITTLKQLRQQDREARKIQKELEEVEKQQKRKDRNEAKVVKVQETLEKEVEMKQMRTDIYTKMVKDAEAYKLKWNL